MNAVAEHLMPILDQPVTATELLSAYFTVGMYSRDVRKELANWDSGHMELINEMLTYAAPLAHMMTAALLVVGVDSGAPGVFLYEVAEPFGSWFVSQVGATGKEPARVEAFAQLRALVIEFYSEVEGCDTATLSAAVRSVHGLLSIH
jgi:hypothetical protein